MVSDYEYVLYCYLENSMSTKELKGTKEYQNNIVCIAMWSFVTYFNYFEIVSTVTFLVSLIRLICVFISVLLYVSLYYYIHGITCAVSGF